MTMVDASEQGAIFKEILSEAAEQIAADRVTVLLNDLSSGELYSCCTVGGLDGQIRFANTLGFAGHVFSTGEVVNVNDPYNDFRFNRDVDTATGYKTETLLCVPVQESDGRTVGVLQAVNSAKGGFDADDRSLFEALAIRVVKALHDQRDA